MTNPKLSPAAQAVWDAVWDTAIQCGDIKGTRRSQVAAALRAAANTLLNHKYWHDGFWDKEPAKFYRKKLLAIAAELEGDQ